MFEPFGKVNGIQLAPDTKPGKHRGWGYITYETLQSAADAIASMNLFELGGQYLRVGRVCGGGGSKAGRGRRGGGEDRKGGEGWGCISGVTREHLPTLAIFSPSFGN